MKIVFMGTPDFSVNALENIVKAGHDVVGVITQPDKPKGRGDHFLQTKQYDLKNEVSVKADYMKNAGEEYSVRCQVFENHEPLIDLTLSVPTEKEASAIALNWQKKNQVVYAWLMSQLL